MLRIILLIFGIAAVLVGLLGFRGQISSNRPWHVWFPDMYYQSRYSAQGESEFFADRRASRPPVANTIPYDGGATRFDAGDRRGPNPDYIPDADLAYFFGRTKRDEKKMVTVEVEREVEADLNGKKVKVKQKFPEEREEIVNYFVERIPKKAIDRAIFADDTQGYKGFEALMRDGRKMFNIHCAACHGETGYGGQGETAHGSVGRGIIDPLTGKRGPGMIGIASYHVDRLREAPDGYLFDVITNGKNTMSSYAHQVPVQDRWAIVAYIRALQLSQNAGKK
jgi:mono/diheme cytochrome c family protein